MTADRAQSIIRGAWQLTPDHLRAQAVADRLAPLEDAVAAGFRVFDCADIYPGVEELLGQVRGSARQQGIELRIHTKCVPDRDQLAHVGPGVVRETVERSLRRLRTDCLDLVQFHWWDYRVPRYLEVLASLFELRREGKIREIGLTNFDGERLSEILDAGFAVRSIQVQYSLLDRRAERSLLPLCRARGIRVFGYGGLLGGFLSERWLGQPAPDDAGLANRSLVKYRLIIDDWGGWDRFQRLLGQIAAIATARACSIAQVAVAALLGSQRVDAVIVGISASHFRQQNAELIRPLALSNDQLRELWSWDCPIEGGVYELERTSARHAGIMKYNLNSDAGTVAGGPA